MIKVYNTSRICIMLFMHNNTYLPLTGLLTLLQWTIQYIVKFFKYFRNISRQKISWNFTLLHMCSTNSMSYKVNHYIDNVDKMSLGTRFAWCCGGSEYSHDEQEAFRCDKGCFGCTKALHSGWAWCGAQRAFAFNLGACSQSIPAGRAPGPRLLLTTNRKSHIRAFD